MSNDTLFEDMRKIAVLLHEHVSSRFFTNPLKGMGPYHAFEVSSPSRSLMLSTRRNLHMPYRNYYLEICDTDRDSGKRDSWFTYVVTSLDATPRSPEYIADCLITRFDDHLKPEGERMFPQRTEF